MPLEEDAASSSTVYLFGSVIRHWRPRDFGGAGSGIEGREISVEQGIEFWKIWTVGTL
jgi:hypothetical protein